jgi:hypothetical protein
LYSRSHQCHLFERTLAVASRGIGMLLRRLQSQRQSNPPHSRRPLLRIACLGLQLPCMHLSRSEDRGRRARDGTPARKELLSDEPSPTTTVYS